MYKQIKKIFLILRLKRNLFFRNNPLSSLKLLIIAKELSALCGLINEPFKEIILNILKKAYWIHLYPALYHQLYAKFSNVSYYLFY